MPHYLEIGLILMTLAIIMAEFPPTFSKKFPPPADGGNR